MQSISYSSKTPLYVNVDIPDSNKCKADDLNEIKTVVNANATECGNASSLNTSATTSLVAGINEVNTKVGTLSSLKTSAKTNLVNSNNELYDMFYYKSGDTITFTEIVLVGFISNSTKSLYFSVILPKNLANITTVNITSFSAELRGINDYLNNTAGYVQYVGASGYTLSSVKGSDNSLNITLVKSTAFTNATNNTPISARVTLTMNLS